MDRLVYTAMSGLRSQMQSQATIANNIANASTIGFRAE
ncbi:flagellar biosynthesis protein FlgF, partial [Escherichia coli]|nr:flagellar biosynthesis protein FlgF [Escherichia coli]